MNTKWLKHSLRDGREVIEYQLKSGERMNGVILKSCKEEKVLGILPVGASYEDGHNYLYAYTDKKETLKDYLSDSIKKETLLSSFESIVNTLVHMQECDIAFAYVALDPEYIYMEEKKARLICLPVENAVMQEEEIPDFFRTILANGVYLNSEDGDYVAKLLSSLNRDFDLNSFLRQIHGLMMDAGIEIVEDVVKESEETPAVQEEKAEEEKVEEEKVEEPPVVVDETETLIHPEAILVQETKKSDSIASETQTAADVIPEEEIEFEPMPEEMAAKIQRMNSNEAEKATASQTQVKPQIQAVPQPVIQPVAQPQAVVAPKPAAQPQAVVTPQPVVQPQSAAAPRPAVQPDNGAAFQPKVDGSPRPLIPPQGVVQPQMNSIPKPKPKPHLTRVKTGEQIMLKEGDFIIGKSPTGLTYTITDNPAVSRIHCTIYKKENGVFYVRDEHSTNSTYVNGEQVLPGTEKILLNNCKLLLGDEEFIYSLW